MAQAIAAMEEKLGVIVPPELRQYLTIHIGVIT